LRSVTALGARVVEPIPTHLEPKAIGATTITGNNIAIITSFVTLDDHVSAHGARLVFAVTVLVHAIFTDFRGTRMDVRTSVMAVDALRRAIPISIRLIKRVGAAVVVDAIAHHLHITALSRAALVATGSAEVHVASGASATRQKPAARRSRSHARSDTRVRLREWTELTRGQHQREDPDAD
jgi:hypothetical protein